VWIPSTGTASDGSTQALTGKYLLPNASVQVTSLGKPEVAFEFNAEGAKLFGQITQRLLNKPLGIFLDGTEISAPTVQAVITDKGVINNIALDQAKILVNQLNSGSLDVPLKIIQQTDVDATMGADSLNKSLIAGLIGIICVALFMIIYYRVPGVVATVALAIYAAILLAIFKIFNVTLTLPGIAGFVISTGMAVDANVLIFERMKEELKRGLTLKMAVQEGFHRAWPSIRDSNSSTIITCAILFWFGNTFGAAMVKGFAVTLFLGVVVSLFSAITVTRTFLMQLVNNGMMKNLTMYGEKKHD
jgi:preprotein translocase subunit SecD